jgi:hypothetical protein
MPCSPLKVNQSFGGTCLLHLQVRRINRARNQRECGWQTMVSCTAHSSTVKMEVKYSSETSVDFSGLYGVVSQRMELFAFITV